MTKQDLQKELLEKVKPGTKPSDIKKLKRSKSAGDIPKVPPSPNKEITQLKEQVKFHAETAANYLQSLQTSQAKVSELETQLKGNPPPQLLTDQLKQKQQEVEDLRKQLESQNTTAELDQSLMARHQNLKDWFIKYGEKKKLDQELAENIDEASNELVAQDNLITNLRKENTNLQKTKTSLEKDLQLSQRLAELRKDYPNNSPTPSYWEYTLYALVTIGFISLLNTSWKNRKYE